MTPNTWLPRFWYRGNLKHLPLVDACRLNFVYIITSWSHLIEISSSTKLAFIAMITSKSLASSSTKFDVLYVEHASEEVSPARSNTLAVLNSRQLSGALARGTITISSVVPLEPQNDNKIRLQWANGNQHPIESPSLDDSNLPPNPINVLNTIVAIQLDKQYSPQSPEPSNPSPISAPPMNLRTIKGFKTPHTTMNDGTFYSQDEPRRVYWDVSSSDSFDSNEPRPVSITSSPFSTPAPSRRQKRKLIKGLSSPQRRGGECRSTLARYMASPHQYERHLNAQKKFKRYIILINFLTLTIKRIFSYCSYRRIRI